MCYRTLIVVAMWAVFAGTAAADVNPGEVPVAQGSFAATCAKVTCRTVTRDLQLRAPNGGTIHVMTTASPYVDEDGVVALYAGEAIEISFDRNALTHPKFVRTIDRVDLEGLKGYQADAPPPDPATPAILSLELRQTEGKPDMTLVLRTKPESR